MSSPGNSSQAGPTSAIAQYNQLTGAYSGIAAQYKQLVSWINAHGQRDMKLWLFQYECMPLLMQGQQVQIEQAAAVQTVVNDVHDAMNKAQYDYNQMLSLPSGASAGTNPPSNLSAAINFKNDMNNLNKMLNTPGINQILGSATVEGLQGYVNDIEKTVTSPGVPGWSSMSSFDIAVQVAKWVESPVTPGASSAGGGGTPPIQAPQLTAINQAFQQFNQNISGVSTQTQAKMQNYVQNLQQFMADFNSNMTAFKSMISTFLGQSSQG